MTPSSGPPRNSNILPTARSWPEPKSYLPANRWRNSPWLAPSPTTVAPSIFSWKLLFCAIDRSARRLSKRIDRSALGGTRFGRLAQEQPDVAMPLDTRLTLAHHRQQLLSFLLELHHLLHDFAQLLL